MHPQPLLQGRLHPDLLALPVRRALGQPRARVTTWQAQPLRYFASNPGSGGLYRVWGTASAPTGTHPWRMILKVIVASGGGTDPAAADYWQREALAYRTGWLEQLPGRLSAPRCYGVAEPAPDQAWLWLQEVPHRGAWSRSDYRLAACHIGTFHAACLVREASAHPTWLSRHRLRLWVQRRRLRANLLAAPETWTNPLVRELIPRAVRDQLLRYNAAYGDLLEALDRLPQTLCHLDAWQANLFPNATLDGTVAVDWANAGLGPLGEDSGNLLAVSVLHGHISPDDAIALDREIFAGYLEGLQAGGWSGQAQQVRLGYTASAALRWVPVAAGGLLQLALDADRHRALEQRSGRTVAELLREPAARLRFLLSLAQEAFSLCRATAQKA